jgi:peptidoglycan/xylan/chitin deacetylase (PgdA/CDA1 family)
MKTEVCITVDTEFSVAGALTYPDRYRPVGERAVRCIIDGREEGLGFLLRSLARFEASATFFIEALQTTYFGDGPMGEIAREIHRAGHDAQLHLHPCWMHFGVPPAHARTRPNDSCSGRSDEELDLFISTGLGTFARWGLPRPVALRTGSLETDLGVYRAMRRAGLALSSNLGLAIYRPPQHELHLHAGLHRIEGIVEAPVLTYRSFRVGRWERLRSLTIQGSSWAELESILWAARRQRISPVVILTHPFEYIKKRGLQYDTVRRNELTQRRFIRLLEFLSAHRAEFSTVTFGRARDAWLAADAQKDAVVEATLLASVRGMVENTLSAHVWHF